MGPHLAARKWDASSSRKSWKAESQRKLQRYQSKARQKTLAQSHLKAGSTIYGAAGGGSCSSG